MKLKVKKVFKKWEITICQIGLYFHITLQLQNLWVDTIFLPSPPHEKKKKILSQICSDWFIILFWSIVTAGLSDFCLRLFKCTIIPDKKICIFTEF